MPSIDLSKDVFRHDKKQDKRAGAGGAMRL